MGQKNDRPPRELMDNRHLPVAPAVAPSGLDEVYGSPAAVYVHIPFCVRKCSYCDFISFAEQPLAIRNAYVDAVLREIDLQAEWSTRQVTRAAGPAWQPRPLSSIFFGGGTPTIINAEALARILARLAEHFGLAKDCEITLEANPETVLASQLKICRDAGFNRISLGLQAIQPPLLNILGRLHSATDFLNSVRLAVEAGFSSINADLMFGLPGQSIGDVVDTLEFLAPLPIDHVSFYSLTLEPGTPLQSLLAEWPDLLAAEETERAQYDLIRQTLSSRGFLHYEISNAARPGRLCRHNLTYWRGQPYYGFGVAAHSFLGGVRRGNTSDLETYLEAFREHADQPFAAALELETVDLAAAQKEMLLLGMRLLEGVPYDAFYRRFGCDMRDGFAMTLRDLVERGLLIQDEAGIRLSETGLDLANQVFLEFV